MGSIRKTSVVLTSPSINTMQIRKDVALEALEYIKTSLVWSIGIGERPQEIPIGWFIIYREGSLRPDGYSNVDPVAELALWASHY